MDLGNTNATNRSYTELKKSPNNQGSYFIDKERGDVEDGGGGGGELSK